MGALATAIVEALLGALGSLWKWLTSLPWYVVAIAALALALVETIDSRSAWEKRATSAEATIADVEVAQADADKAWNAGLGRVDAKQADITKGTDHASSAAADALRADYATYRRLHPDTPRPSGSAGVPGIPESAARPDCPARADATVPLAQLIDFAEQGDLWRQRIADVQKWYADQAAVGRTPVSPPTP